MGAYFENQMFSARANYTYRTAFLIGLSGANPYYQDDFGTLGRGAQLQAHRVAQRQSGCVEPQQPELTYYQSATAPTAFYNNGRAVLLNLFKY